MAVAQVSDGSPRLSPMLADFVHGFVLPLLRGGDLHVGRPLRPKDRDAMALDLGSLAGHRELVFARNRRTELYSPHPLLDEPDHDELSLWVGLHNLLVFDHPDRIRVWARGSTWRRVEGVTRTMLTLPFPSSVSEGLARHVCVGALIDLRRTDILVNTATGENRYLGQEIPRRRFFLSTPVGAAAREETVDWYVQPHAPETHRLLEDALRASPLTCLLNPLIAPPGWSPLWATDFLRERGFARAVCHRWARHKDWISVGGAVMSALLPSLPSRPTPDRGGRGQAGAGGGPLALPGAVAPTGPEALGAVVGALIHLHFLKVLELDARLGVALSSRDPAILSFLALPLLLPRLAEVIGTPTAGLERPRGGVSSAEGLETQAQRLWTEYLDHLQELVPRSTVENLLATLVPPIVPTS